MAQTIINSNAYDLYNFADNGRWGESVRYIRETQQTLAESSRTVTTTHKKIFSFSLLNLTTTQRDAIMTAFALNSFTFQPLPYDSTIYTVKVTSDGNIPIRSNTTEYWDITGIVLEVA